MERNDRETDVTLLTNTVVFTVISSPILFIYLFIFLPCFQEYLKLFYIYINTIYIFLLLYPNYVKGASVLEKQNSSSSVKQLQVYHKILIIG